MTGKNRLWETIEDIEKRVRALEKWRYQLPATLACSAFSLVLGVMELMK
jgi:hypothetical protein